MNEDMLFDRSISCSLRVLCELKLGVSSSILSAPSLDKTIAVRGANMDLPHAFIKDVKRVELDGKPCVVVGQSGLMDFYDNLSQLDVASSQLVTNNKFKDPNFRRQMSEIVVSLLELHVVLIFNENDAVSTRKAPYEGATSISWDNDTPPQVSDPRSKLINTYLKEKHDEAIAFGDKSRASRGGKTTKVKAARHAALASIPVVITSGYVAGGKEATQSNAILHKVITKALLKLVGRELIGLVTSRDEIPYLLKLDDFIDLVIPRESNKRVSKIKESTFIQLNPRPLIFYKPNGGICATNYSMQISEEFVVEVVQEASRITMSNSQGRSGLDNVPTHKHFSKTNHYVYEDLICILGIGRMESGNNSNISMLARDKSNLSKFGGNCNPAHIEFVQGIQFPLLSIMDYINQMDSLILLLSKLNFKPHLATLSTDRTFQGPRLILLHGRLSLCAILGVKSSPGPVMKMMDIYGQALILKYQLPYEDLDALVFVSSDEDLENMIEEYDRLENSEGSSRLQVFLFIAIDQDLAQFDAMADRRHSE
eukprot:Gb_37747 [translate_table: standard]